MTRSTGNGPLVAVAATVAGVGAAHFVKPELWAAFRVARPRPDAAA